MLNKKFNNNSGRLRSELALFDSAATRNKLERKKIDRFWSQTVFSQLFANETSNPSLFTACNIQINVGNENDNEPVFTRAHYYVNVSENGKYAYH